MSLSVIRATEPPLDWAVLARKRGLFYHHPTWVRLLARTFRFPLVCLTAIQDGALVGALALAQVPPLFGPRRLVSLPFSYAAGPVSDSAEAETLLMEAAREEAARRGVGRLEIKRRAPISQPSPGFTRTAHYSTYLVPTEGGEKAVWALLHPGSTRRGIRKAERDGVSVRRGESIDDWREMARLEERTAHGHGVPAPPRRFFLEACRGLQAEGLADLYLARLKGGEVAAGITIWKGARDWVYAFGASRPSYLVHRPNHLLLWTAIRDAIGAGVGFDLGRAAPEQEGLVEFKRRWGGQPVSLGYDYWPSVGGLNTADRSHGSLALAARVWSRLPAPVTRLGSVLYRYLG